MVESPCNKVCLLDPANGLCIGCGRTAAEIGAWPTMRDEERAALLSELPLRLSRLGA